MVEAGAKTGAEAGGNAGGNAGAEAGAAGRGGAGGPRAVDMAGRAAVLAVLQALILAFFVAGTHGWISGKVQPSTTDFASFYAAGALADAGRPAAAYDRAAHLAAEEAATAPGISYQHFFNPPPYLLINQPLARLPYMAAFLVFEAATLLAWLVVGTRAAGGGAAAALCLLAVPSVWWVLGLGQNGFLNAALMGAGLLALERRPLLAGMLLGALIYKPNLGLLLPVALLAGRYWRAVAASGLSAGVLCALSLALYGWPTWRAYADMAAHAGAAMNGGDVLLAARLDPAGALAFAGLGLGAARAAGLAVAAMVALCVAWLWARRAVAEARYAALVAGTLLVVPFVLFYDLVLASLAAAFLARLGRRAGFLPGEPGLLMLCVVLNLAAAVPVVPRMAHGVQPGALVAVILFALALRRGWRDRPAGAGAAGAGSAGVGAASVGAAGVGA